MVVKAAKKTQIETNDQDKVQLELVTMTPTQKRQEVTNLIAQIKLKKVERQKYLGHAKTIKNEIDELLDRAEKLAAEAATGQIKIELEALLAEDDDDGDLEGRVMDQSNIKKPGDFTKSLQDSLDEAGEEGTGDE